MLQVAAACFARDHVVGSGVESTLCRWRVPGEGVGMIGELWMDLTSEKIKIR